MNFDSLEFSITLHAPKVFKSFCEIDRKMINFDLSFNIHNNWKYIKKQFGDEGDGGKR